MPQQITDPQTKDQYYVNSLIEEAVTSSQIEGATTTRPIAAEMIRSGRRPRNRSERMILNNYLAMRHISELKNEPLTKELVFNLHRTITEGTLDDESQAGRFRTDGNKPIAVVDESGEIFHVPPPSHELEERMASMCDFANGKTPGEWLHPVLRAVILHFWLAYDHPFVDGNGRTARALFYWTMLRHDYWLFEFFSISHIIRKGPTQYSRAFLYTESDDNDLTYFILYDLDAIRRALDEFNAYVQRKTEQHRAVENRLQAMKLLNHRQSVLIGHALRHPRHRYTVESHRASHNVVYETARHDLLGLKDRGLLRARKEGRTWYFTPVEDLEKRLGELS